MIRYPRALRPCCAFGHDLEVEVGRLPVPGVEIGNLLGPGDVGRHRYDNGFLSLELSDPRGFVLFPASIASAFTCGENLAPYFRKTPAGYESFPITDYESERVELPCASKPGRYPYEIRVMGTGCGETGVSPEPKLRGTIVVE